MENKLSHIDPEEFDLDSLVYVTAVSGGRKQLVVDAAVIMESHDDENNHLEEIASLIRAAMRKYGVYQVATRTSA